MFGTLLAGILVFFVLEKLVLLRHCHTDECDVHAATAPLVIIGDAFHNFIDGAIICTAVLSSVPLGINTALAVAAHEIPQEVGDVGHPARRRLQPAARAAPQHRVRRIRYRWARCSRTALSRVIPGIRPYVLAFSAASLLYIAMSDLIPDLHRGAVDANGIRQVMLIARASAPSWRSNVHSGDAATMFFAERPRTRTFSGLLTPCQSARPGGNRLVPWHVICPRSSARQTPESRINMLRKFGGLAVGLTVGCVGLLAEHGIIDRADLQLARDASVALNRYTQLTIFDNVEIAVSGGFITLTGDVTMPHKREDIAKRVALVEGVRDVRNQIRVLPASTSDDQLRYQIARAIYDSPHFWHYALGPNPPIRIIVERGHVTLAGTVHNDTDRTIARSLAGQFPALSLTNKLKTSTELRDRRAIGR